VKHRRVARQIQRDLRIRAAVAGCVMTAVGTVSLADTVLGPLRWENRVLLAFATEGDEPQLLATRALAEANADGFADRDLVLGVVLEGEGTLGPRSLSRKEREELKRRFGITGSGFLVILIGKDGSEKLRLERPPNRDALFALIDSMPMRMHEMQSGEP
jgi:hypothetical protein